MRIFRKCGIEAAPESEGCVVVIDVLRAFTTAAFAFSRGAEKIILVSEAEEAFRLKRSDGSLLLVGEIGGRRIPGFDHGNSPEAMSALDLTRRTVVLRSSSGTQGVVFSHRAEGRYLGSLVVARATMEHLRAREAERITLLAMGAPGGIDLEEDVACADYMHAILDGRSVDPEHTIQRVEESPAGQVALDPEVDWKTPGDLACATRIDCFDFAMPVTLEDGLWVARPVSV